MLEYKNWRFILDNHHEGDGIRLEYTFDRRSSSQIGKFPTF